MPVNFLKARSRIRPHSGFYRQHVCALFVDLWSSYMKKATLASIIVISWISLFLLPLSSAALAANSASFVKIDFDTMGNWIGRYGADGHNLSQYSNSKIPAYAKVTLSGHSNYTWAASANPLSALQKPENQIDRIAATWYAPKTYTIDVNFTDGNSHQIALYALDYDSTVRAETINVRDVSNGVVLDSRSLSAGSFRDGVYLVWNVRGHVKFEVVLKAGANAVVSGLFFGGAPPPSQGATLAVPADTFLSSLGVGTHMGQGYPETNYIPMFRYLGVRNDRDGTDSLQLHISKQVNLYKNTGVRIAFGVRCKDLTDSINAAKILAKEGALLALEGANEPNNFPITYNGQKGGGSGTWLPVAQCQRDLYARVKADPVLKNYPVFSVSEGGAEFDNVGLQFLTIPAGSGTLMPAGTKYADYANPHNYVTGHFHVLYDNAAWHAADPILRTRWDGLGSEYGITWVRKYKGYSDAQLVNLPRVTTETGWGTTGAGSLTEVQQAKVLLNVYLSQFKRGWRYTFIYQMRDQEGGDTRSFGLFHYDLTPKVAATYIHNLTTILADTVVKAPDKLNYWIQGEPAPVHNLLLQKSNGTFYLIMWDERRPGTGTDNITVSLGEPHASVKIYDPTLGTGVIKSLSNVSSIPLTLSDHPLILAISKP